MAQKNPISVIDLFAGPGGLGEGFSSLVDDKDNKHFVVKVSIEKDPIAHRTLSLRALFRAFGKGRAPDCYYDYVRGHITRQEFFANPSIAENMRATAAEAKCAELGKTPHRTIDNWIKKALDGTTEWVLIGGPPCQAYSVAGRARLRPKDSTKFENDERHFLYTEYLRIIRQFGPSVFIMENVKGMLTSKHGGTLIFDRILSDLAEPGNGLQYSIRSLVVGGADLDPQDYVIKAEKFGVPQSRHRVILFGIRSDLVASTPILAKYPGRFVLKPSEQRIGVKAALSGLPPLRSRLSREPDSHETWLSVLKTAPLGLKGWRSPLCTELGLAMERAWKKAAEYESGGGQFAAESLTFDAMPVELRAWLHDPKLCGVLQHETRSHMRSDLHRYMFASCFAASQSYSPKLPIFPPNLLPNHGNMDNDSVPFLDRFRVQLAEGPSTTVVAHIAKDGHYYIHHDPSQCRSLTVREVARLQTFPDNYFFEGNRTQQYGQIGNAVPPLLARKVAEVVLDFIRASHD
ncbi:MAG: DNA cytosine methyltransferase [Porticoccaceae bacterium]